VPEIEKALAELHALMAYRQRYNDPENAPGIGPSGTYPGRDTPLPEGQGVPEEILAAGLSSRKNLCVHPSVGRERKGKVVDARCRDMTSAWACEKGRAEPGSVELCDFHEVSEMGGAGGGRMKHVGAERSHERRAATSAVALHRVLLM
jgi:DNA excision repair protein ERCC-2